MENNTSSDFKYVRPASPATEAGESQTTDDDELIIITADSQLESGRTLTDGNTGATSSTAKLQLSSEGNLEQPGGLVSVSDDAGDVTDDALGGPMPLAQKIVIACAGVGVIVLAVFLIIHWLL
jgi:hypothetical protein